jgi:hypothetical protein
VRRRRVLKEALKLELISALISPVDYARAIDISSVKASKELRGRALSQEEIDSLMHSWKFWGVRGVSYFLARKIVE